MVTKEMVEKAYKNLVNAVERTPVKNARENVFLKLENLQKTGSYKVRGAYNFISLLSDKEKSRGVVCASTGNHALGVAYSCSVLGVKGTVFMPEHTLERKIEKVRTYSCDVCLVKGSFDDASKSAEEFASETNSVFVHPFDNPYVVAGQGTIAVELFEQLKNIEYLLVPVGGGGLITGIAAYFKRVSPQTVIVSVEPENSCCFYDAVRHNERVTLETVDTFVDAVAVKRVGEIAFNSRKLVDVFLKVPNETIEYAMAHICMKVEPAGALAFAGTYSQFMAETKGNVCCIVSGGNGKK